LKSKSLVYIAVLLLCSFAWSQTAQCKKPTPVPTPTPVSTDPTSVGSSSSSSSLSSSSASSSSNATGGNASATGGNAQQSQAAVNGGNSVNEVTNIPRQAPPAIAPPVLNGLCLGGISAGASSTVGGLSFGKSTADKNCQAMNLAAFLAAYHNYDGAAKAICSSDAAKRAHLSLDDCKLIGMQIVPPPAPQPVVVHDQVPPQIVVIEPPITVTPTPEQIKEVTPIKHVVKPVNKSVVHKAKPCAVNPVVPNSLKEPQ
jgi:hypothetical protein